MRKARARWRDNARSRGTCINCGVDLAPEGRIGKCFCHACQWDRNAYDQDRQDAMRARGLCRCGRPRQEGYLTCARCGRRFQNVN
jgi:hypothetical protein